MLLLFTNHSFFYISIFYISNASINVAYAKRKYSFLSEFFYTNYLTPGKRMNYFPIYLKEKKNKNYQNYELIFFNSRTFGDRFYV